MGWRCRMSRGFTLLEILVVMAIAGLLAGVVLPQLRTIAQSVEIASQRTEVKSAIESLGYRAYATGKAVTLADIDPDRGRSNGASAPPAIALPTGWQVRAQQPVYYSASGVCSGGKIEIVDPARGREAFRLEPPRCRLEAVELRD